MMWRCPMHRNESNMKFRQSVSKSTRVKPKLCLVFELTENPVGAFYCQTSSVTHYSCEICPVHALDLPTVEVFDYCCLQVILRVCLSESICNDELVCRRRLERMIPISFMQNACAGHARCRSAGLAWEQRNISLNLISDANVHPPKVE